MRIYVAGPWAHRHTAKDAAQTLREAGHEIVSRWHDIWADADTTDPLMLEQEAVLDLQDVDASNVVVVLNIEKSEGKALEQGFALALGIPVVVVGARSNVFHYLPQVRIQPDLASALECLSWL